MGHVAVPEGWRYVALIEVDLLVGLVAAARPVSGVRDEVALHRVVVDVGGNGVGGFGAVGVGVVIAGFPDGHVRAGGFDLDALVERRGMSFQVASVALFQ